MRPRPERLEQLPEQFFASLMRRVGSAGPDVLDLGRGNPEVGPPDYVAEALREGALGGATIHGYAPFRGLPKLKEAIVRRYRDVYDVELDPEREVALVPGGKTGLIELCLALADRGETVLLPDPYYPDYLSGVALAEAKVGLLRLDADNAFSADLDSAPSAAALFLNYPSNPCAACAPPGAFEAMVDYAQRTGTPVVHDAAYIDLVFDGRRPASFLATPGAKEVGVELWTMSKTYGMAGWRLAFVVGNAEIVERINLQTDHTRVGVFAPLQHAAIAALTGPQDAVEERRAAYERRRDRLVEALPGAPVSQGTFYVWYRLPEGVTADRLLTECGVVVAPGEGFGPSGAGWARISLAVTDETLERGIERMAPLLEAAYA